MRDSPLQFAALRNFADTVEALMKATPPEKHTRAVVSAIESRAEHSLLRLLECGADCQGVDSGGRTVLHYAAIHANTPILRVLVSFREALPSSRLVDNVGYSPSFYAEKRDNKDFSLHQWYLLTGSGDNFDRVIEVESKDTSVLTHID
jgi:ankyrin repeat protein